MRLSFRIVIFAASAVATLGADADSAAFAKLAALEVSQLHDGVTLAQWMNTRGRAEKWDFSKPEIIPTQSHYKECGRLTRSDQLPSGLKVIRAIYLTEPPAPARLTFPAANAQALLNSCTISRLRMEVEAPTPEIGASFRQAVREELTKSYGAPIGNKEAPFWGRGPHDDNADRWVRGAEIVSGYDGKPGHAYPPSDVAYSPRDVVVGGSAFAYVPGELFVGPVAFVRARLPIPENRDIYPYSVEGGCRYCDLFKEQFERAVGLAGIDATLSQKFRTLYQQLFDLSRLQRPSDAATRAVFLPALRDWLNALKPLPTARRAAGLLAADRLIDVSDSLPGKVPGWPGLEHKGGISELQELGAAFGVNGIAGVYFYTGNWRKEARTLDPNGPVGEMVLVGSMAYEPCDVLGWNTENFRPVIADGERLLAKNLDTALAAQVHFMVGDAYSDIVAIAGGGTGPDEGFSVPETPAKVDSDRRKALEHYRAGLAVDSTSVNAKAAWFQAWRLNAALLPQSRYLCAGD